MSRKVAAVLSHWHHMLDGYQGTPLQFYQSLERVIQLREVPDTKVSRIVYSEGGIFSAKREYFRVQRKELIFDICAAPFGDGYFVSWWLGESLGIFWSLVTSIPLLGGLMHRLFKPATYYHLDTTLMFQNIVHSAVIDVVDEITNSHGLRALTELERKPVMSQMFSSNNISG